MIGRSKKIESKSLRGGVAVYKNNLSDMVLETVYDDLVDCVICRIVNTDVILVAMYIPPSNSVYFNEKYFQNLDTIYSIFNSCQLLIMGDLNCRVGIPPDNTVNTNGSRLQKWLHGKDVNILNGFKANNKTFDSKFTFFRGAACSQNDLILSNNVSIVDSVKILKKEIYSDHTPISVSIIVAPWCSINFIESCARGTLSDDHWDINKRKVQPLISSKIDWPSAILQLEENAVSIMESVRESDSSNNHIVSLLTKSIYDACRNNYIQRREEVGIPPTQNMQSANLKAIANMNFYTYNFHTQNGADMDVRRPYLENYLLYEKLAKDTENREINLRKNSAWKRAKGDGKTMWKFIDWKGKADLKKEALIQETDITPYFKRIFQSEKTQNHPKVESIQDRLDTYMCYVPELDDPFTLKELEFAVKKVGSGCGLDGIRAEVIQMLPPSFMKCVLEVFKRVFVGEYPEQWEMQILNAVAKDGHNSKNPKLRGVGIAAVLARVYDIILDVRFKGWYTPNREQAGFCTGQGCPLPLFSIFLLLHYAVKNGKDFCIGFMDYEKAFDYANRAKIVSKLMDRGCGRVFTDAIAKMFHSTTYIPSTNNRLCEAITTSYGVAQGRNSSPDIYSFSVSDMATCTDSMDTKDFIDPNNLAQLADDTAMLAEGMVMLGPKMKCLLDYSEEIYQVPNIPKTVYCHFSKDPCTTKLYIDENTQLSSVDPIKGHRYLGVKFLPTKDINKIIKFNIEGRSHNWSKFYSWLEINEETPIEIKLLVLDTCFFMSILHSVEVFGDISCVEKKLRLDEQKALKAILKVKSGTSTDLLYNELKRPDVISRIKDSQYRFYHKVKDLNENEAVVRSILELCKETPIVEYYESLQEFNQEMNIEERTNRIRNSERSMPQYYNEMVNVDEKSKIYSNFVDDRYRFVITRWRLSNHKLRIETGRYHTPYIPREERKCFECGVLEDEKHVIYVCPAFSHIRANFGRVVTKYPSVSSFLNPDPSDIYDVSTMLSKIDNILNDR